MATGILEQHLTADEIATVRAIFGKLPRDAQLWEAIPGWTMVPITLEQMARLTRAHAPDESPFTDPEQERILGRVGIDARRARALAAIFDQWGHLGIRYLEAAQATIAIAAKINELASIPDSGIPSKETLGARLHAEMALLGSAFGHAVAEFAAACGMGATNDAPREARDGA